MFAALLVLCLTALGAPVTLAVLPLDKGAGSTDYDGLGKALGAMMITDLAQVPDVVVVERDRLDAVLGELELGASDFVDPATAQRAGKGLGAQILVTGTWSVIDDSLSVDVRAISVEQGTVVNTARAAGPVADFVSVEKEAVDGLLGELDVAVTSAVRRKLYMQAPTEAFSAFVAYAEGLDAADEGRVEQAAAAFERAVQVDPGFQAAQTQLTSLRAAVERVRTERVDRALTERGRAHQAVLEAFPDERTLEDDFVDTKESNIGFLMRLAALENEQLDCQRYEELRHYLERHDWSIRPIDVHTRDLRDAFAENGIVADRTGNGPEITKSNPSGRTYEVFATTADLILGQQGTRIYNDGSGLMGSIRKCFSPQEQLRVIDDLRAVLRKEGKSGERIRRGPDLGLDTHLQLHWAWVAADHSGAHAELTRRTEALLTLDVSEPDRLFISGAVDMVMRRVRQWEEREVRRLHQSESRLVTVMNELAAGGGGLVRDNNPYCSYMLKNWAPRAEAWIAHYESTSDAHPDLVDTVLNQTGLYYGPLRDMGCIREVPARFSGLEEIYPFMEGALQSLKDDRDCAQATVALKSVTTTESQKLAAQTPDAAPSYASMVLQSWYGGPVFWMCVQGD